LERHRASQAAIAATSYFDKRSQRLRADGGITIPPAQLPEQAGDTVRQYCNPEYAENRGERLGERLELFLPWGRQ
jgi:hypothetical protein